jgi:hypothetical protein
MRRNGSPSALRSCRSFCPAGFFIHTQIAVLNLRHFATARRRIRVFADVNLEFLG